MKRKEIDFITLGCSKNLVDAERVMRQLEAVGWKCVHDPEEPKAEVCVINTCGFIGDAKEESINMILQMAERKKHGKLRKLIVMGCLSERYRAELESELPEVDAYYGKFDFENMVKQLEISKSRNLEMQLIRTTSDDTQALCVPQDFRGLQPDVLLLRHSAHHRKTYQPS